MATQALSAAPSECLSGHAKSRAALSALPLTYDVVSSFTYLYRTGRSHCGVSRQSWGAIVSPNNGLARASHYSNNQAQAEPSLPSHMVGGTPSSTYVFGTIEPFFHPILMQPHLSTELVTNEVYVPLTR